MRFQAIVPMAASFLIMFAAGCKSRGSAGSGVKEEEASSNVPTPGVPSTTLKLEDLKTMNRAKWITLFEGGVANPSLIPTREHPGVPFLGSGYPQIAFETDGAAILDKIFPAGAPIAARGAITVFTRFLSTTFNADFANKIWNGKELTTREVNGVLSTSLINQFVQNSANIQLFTAQVVPSTTRLQSTPGPIILLDYTNTGVPLISQIRDELRLVSERFDNVERNGQSQTERRRLYLGPTFINKGTGTETAINLLARALSLAGGITTAAAEEAITSTPVLWFALEFREPMTPNSRPQMPDVPEE